MAKGNAYANSHASEQAPIHEAAIATREIDHVIEVIITNFWANETLMPATSSSCPLSGRVVSF